VFSGLVGADVVPGEQQRNYGTQIMHKLGPYLTLETEFRASYFLRVRVGLILVLS